MAHDDQKPGLDPDFIPPGPVDRDGTVVDKTPEAKREGTIYVPGAHPNHGVEML